MHGAHPFHALEANCASSEATARAAGFAPSRLALITEVLRADCDSATIPGAVLLIARESRIAYFEAFGMADRRVARPMAGNSIFRIASLTKPLTAVAALMLAERGRLALVDPVARFLPELRDVPVGREVLDARGERRLELEACRQAMTVHDLLRHTAGFTYGQHGDSLVHRAYRAAQAIDDAQTNAQLVAKLARLPLIHQPGTSFAYGMSTDVLGRVIEVVADQPLDRFFAEHLTGPLGMRDTGFGVRSGDRHRLAEPLRAAAPDEPPAVTPYDPARPAKWFSGGGGLLSTAYDYARFCQMLLNRGELDGTRLLGRKSIDLMLANHLAAGLDYAPQTASLGIAAPLPALGQGYGLGVGVRTAAGLSSVPGSAGDFYWGGALGPYFWADPHERLLVVFMLQELDAQKRGRYRSLLRNLVYQAMD